MLQGDWKVFLLPGDGMDKFEFGLKILSAENLWKNHCFIIYDNSREVSEFFPTCFLFFFVDYRDTGWKSSTEKEFDFGKTLIYLKMLFSTTGKF